MTIRHGSWNWDVHIVDDGTLDTVVHVENSVTGKKSIGRFDTDYASEYRDSNGAMTAGGLEILAIDTINAMEYDS